MLNKFHLLVNINADSKKIDEDKRMCLFNNNLLEKQE